MRDETALSSRPLGFALLFAVALIWIISSFISEALVNGSDKGTEAVPPLLLTYAASSLFTVYLPLVHGRRLVRWLWSCYGQPTCKRAMTTIRSKVLLKAGGSGGAWQAVPTDPAQLGDAPPAACLADDAAGPFAAAAAAAEPALQDRVAFRAALWATPLWFLAQYAFNTSLAYTSVTSNTIISATSSLFTYGLSILYLDEQHSTGKLVGILACIGGVALVTLSDSSSGSGSSKGVTGDVLCLVSAAVYGAYTVMMRLRLPDGDNEPTTLALFFGYVGLISTVVLAPVLILAFAAGYMSVAGVTRHVVGLIVLEGLLDYVLADYLWARSVMLLGPTLATLGLSVQIPLAAVAELLFGHPAWILKATTIAMTISGTALILAGFFFVNTKEAKEAQEVEAHQRESAAESGRQSLEYEGVSYRGSYRDSRDSDATVVTMCQMCQVGVVSSGTRGSNGAFALSPSACLACLAVNEEVQSSTLPPSTACRSDFDLQDDSAASSLRGDGDGAGPASGHVGPPVVPQSESATAPVCSEHAASGHGEVGVNGKQGAGFARLQADGVSRQ